MTLAETASYIYIVIINNPTGGHFFLSYMIHTYTPPIYIYIAKVISTVQFGGIDRIDSCDRMDWCDCIACIEYLKKYYLLSFCLTKFRENVFG